MNIMKKIGVQPMRIIKGQTGLYFKFADGLSSNAQAIELFFKPKFVKARYEVKPGKLEKILWMEINILWVGPEEFPEFEGGWKPTRKGSYQTKEGEVMGGYLLGKIYLPMGEFNDDLPKMHQWLADKADEIGGFVQSLISQVSGTVYMPLSTIFNYMLEQVSMESFAVNKVEIYLNEEFNAYQHKALKSAEAKFPVSGEESKGEGENGPGLDSNGFI